MCCYCAQESGQSLASGAPDDLKTKRKIENELLNVEELHCRGAALACQVGGVAGASVMRQYLLGDPLHGVQPKWLCLAAMASRSCTRARHIAAHV